MDLSEPDTDQLIRLAAHGDPSAVRQLFTLHRAQLRRMVSVRIDPRLAARLDESDIIQDAMMEASRRLQDYCRKRELPFHLWLRGIALERLIQLHRHHVDRQKRSVDRERPGELPLSHRSATQLMDRLATSDTSPSDRVMRKESSDRAQSALQQLPVKFREVLVLRYLEQLSVEETSIVLGVSAGTVKSRQFRAIARLHEQMLGENPFEPGIQD